MGFFLCGWSSWVEGLYVESGGGAFLVIRVVIVCFGCVGSFREGVKGFI